MFLSRPRFDIHDCSCETLDDIAKFHLRLFEYLPGTNRYKPNYSLSLQLHGVPRNQLIAVQNELEMRLIPLGFKTIRLGPPGTLIMRTTEAELNAAPPVPGLGVSQLAGKPFEGLVLELRFTIRGNRKARSDSTLVLVGELKSGRLEVRALWREGRYGDPNKDFQNIPWHLEGQFWSSFQAFQDDDPRETDDTLQLAQSMFPLIKGERSSQLQYIYLMPFHFGKPRLRGLLFRGLLWSSLAILGLFLKPAFATSTNSDEITSVLFWCFSIVFAFPLFVFLVHEIRLLWLFRRDLSNRFHRLYQQDLHLVEARPERVTEHTANCYFRQVAEELREQGYRLLGHQEFGSESDAIAVVSVFANERDCTEVHLITMREDATALGEIRNQYWPAHVTVVTQSQFTNGYIGVMFNSYADAWRRMLPGKYEVRYLSKTESMGQHLQLHMQWCKEYMQKHGVSQVARNYDEIVRMQKERLKQECEYFRDKPLTLGDLVNFWLQRTRPEYRY